MLYTTQGGTFTEKNLSYAVLLDYYGSLLTERQHDLLELYYNEDYSLSEISENTGISRQGVRDAIKRGEAELDRLEEALGIASTQTARRAEAESICAELRAIADDAGTDDIRTRLIAAESRVRALAGE